MTGAIYTLVNKKQLMVEGTTNENKINKVTVGCVKTKRPIR